METISNSLSNMDMLDRIAKSMATDGKDPLLGRTQIITKRECTTNPRTPKELDKAMGNLAAVSKDGRRFYTYSRSDGTGRLDIIALNGYEVTYSFRLPVAEAPQQPSALQVPPTPPKTVTTELEQVVERIKKAEPSYPTSIGDIPKFPFTTFEDMLKAISSKKFVIARFSFQQDMQMLGLVSPSSSPFYILSVCATYLVPIVAIALAFLLSHWFWFGVLYFFIGVRMTTAIWQASIIKAAQSSELAFCFLFYASKINAYDITTATDYEWGQLTRKC